MTPEQMGTIAARYDTTMSWAMLRCLCLMGVTVAVPRERTHAYDHLTWCMLNYDVPNQRKRREGM